MENERIFAQKIRNQYTEKEPTALDELRRLDSEVKRPANILAYCIGGVSAVVMGAGMSLVMTDIGETLGIPSAFAIGIVIGAVGLCAALLNYPLYKRIVNGRKEKYGEKIIALSDKIINDKN